MAKIKKSLAYPKLQAPKSLTRSTIVVTNSQRAIRISSSSVQKAVGYLLDACNISCEEIAIHFVGEKRISSLHAQFFDDPSPTDCITFPAHSPQSIPCPHLGEIFVCPLVAKKYAKNHGCNLYEELTLYVVHGFLHLLGYEDTSVEKQKKMRIQEKKWILALAKNSLLITP